MTVKIVPDMTYNVFGGALNLAQSLNLLNYDDDGNDYRIFVHQSCICI